jgi:DNA-binding CsgD family transcriptional regulator
MLSQYFGATWARTNVYTQLALIASALGETHQAQRFAQEALSLAQITGNKVFITPIHYCLGDLAWRQDEKAAALAWYAQGLIYAREMGYSSYIIIALSKLGKMALLEGDTVQAANWTQEGLEVARKRGERQSICQFLILLGEIVHQQGNDTLALACFQESLSIARARADTSTIGDCLLGLSALALSAKQFWQVARMRAAAESRLNLGQEITLRKQAIYEQENEALRAHLGETAFAKAWAQGQTMMLEELLAAPEPTALPTSSREPTEELPGHLTKREAEVLHLLAQGLTDAQIGDRLVISPRTVNFHLTRIYQKIQVSSRSAATRYAIEHHFA